MITCRVHDTELKSTAESSDKEKTYELPDGSIITVGAESVAILAQGDVLFGRFSLVGTARSYDHCWLVFSSYPDE